MFSIESLRGKYSSVRDTLHYHCIEQFTRTICLYIPTWVRSFTYLMESWCPRGRRQCLQNGEVGQSLSKGSWVQWQTINNVHDRALGVALEYEVLLIIYSLDDLKGWLVPLISDTTSRWIEVGSLLRRRIQFVLISSTIITSEMSPSFATPR